MVAVLMVALLGMAALAVDVGAVYSEKAQVQNGADFSALAIAGDCAKDDCGDYLATGNGLANGNANDNSTGIASITFPNANTVRVETKTREAGSGKDHFSLFFARALGIDTADVGAVAEAIWGPPDEGSTLPWTVSECVFRQSLTPAQLHDLDTTGDFSGDPSGTRILLRYEEKAPEVPGCGDDNGYMPGGFGWLQIASDCSAEIDISAEVKGQPGNHFPTAAECDAILDGILEKPALIPLYDTAVGNGDKTIYTLVGFAAFQVTGYKFGGSLEIDDDLAPDCDKNCRGLQGHFVRYVSLAEGVAPSGGPNFGALSVSLSK